MEIPLGQRLKELPGPLLLTGHTGFKGTWMTFLLEHLKVSVVGYSLPAEKDSLFDRAERIGAIPEEFSDIRDYAALERFIDLHKPSTIIHMAAQPLVLKSYESPRETFDVNVMGTVNVLDIAFKRDFIEAIIVVTTDKVYRNDNSGRAFVESDPLEGKDPYSASKVGTEAVVAAWQQIAKVSGGPKVVSVRAGNVVGGGDFAENRIIPDLIRGILGDKPVEIRNPNSTRPWQHVLEPLIGYLNTLQFIMTKEGLTSLNFGPSGEELTVIQVAQIARSFFQTFTDLAFDSGDSISKSVFEAKVLGIDSNLAKKKLGYREVFSQVEAIEKSMEWWRDVLSGKITCQAACERDIKIFLEKLSTTQKISEGNI